MVLNPDFREFVALSNVFEVRYLIVGGCTVAFHGHPRYTKELDVWVQRDPANARRLVNALAAFGFGSVGVSEGDFLEEGQVIQLGLPPNRIDLLTSLEGVRFDTCRASKATEEIDGILVDFIGLDDLRRNKRAVGRHQDLADLENLQ